MNEPTKEQIVADTAIGLVQFIQTHDGDLHLLNGLLFDLKETAMLNGVTHEAADAYCNDVNVAVRKLWTALNTQTSHC